LDHHAAGWVYRDRWRRALGIAVHPIAGLVLGLVLWLGVRNFGRLPFLRSLVAHGSFDDPDFCRHLRLLRPSAFSRTCKNQHFLLYLFIA
jgi:hypothetical protein